ncbi:MAG: tetratricopeptide repeat protein [Elusimicrobiales bacterium]
MRTRWRGGVPRWGTCMGKNKKKFSDAPAPDLAPAVLRRAWLADALIILAALAVFWPAAGGGFVNWDDPDYVTGNPSIVNPGWGGVFSAASTASAIVLYHPLTLALYKLIYMAAGPAPSAFHCAGIALHLVCCVLFRRFALALGLDFYGALFAGLLFAVHPLRAESVAWISGMKDPLCGAFFFGSLLLYLKRTRTGLAASAALFAAALLSKPAIAGGVFIFPLLDWHEKRGLRLPEKTPYFIAAAAVTALTFRTGSFFLPRQAAASSAAGMLAAFGPGALFYLKKILLPSGLCAVYPLAASGAGATAALAAFGALLLRLKERLYAFGFAFFCLALAPALAFYHVAPADRYSYIPAAGIFLMAGAAFARFYGCARKPALACAAAAALALGWQSADRVKAWNSSLSLWNDAARTCAESGDARLYSVIYSNRGAANLDAGNREAAAEDFTAALQFARDGGIRAEIFRRRGRALLASGRAEEAAGDFTRSLELKPGQPAVCNDRGAVYTALGRYNQAIDDYSRAIAQAPGFADAYANRGIAYGKSGRHAQALEDFNKALSLSPDNALARAGLNAARRHLQ